VRDVETTNAPDRRPAAAEVEARIERVRELLDRRGAERAVLRARRNFAWLTVGGQSHVVLATDAGAADLVIDRAGARVRAPINEAARLRDEELAGLPIDIEQRPWEEVDATDVDDETLEPELAPIRARLAGLEQARMTWLGSTLTHVLDETATRVRRGDTELDCVGEILGRLARLDIRAPVALVAADDRIARYRHPLPTANAIERRVMLVAVGERWGLHVALTRIRELEPPSAVIEARRSAAASVHDAMVAASVPGATLGAVIEAAQNAYAEAGFPDEWRLHHQGGLLGYRPRERIAVPQDPTVLAEHMAVAWNPSITGTKVEASYLLVGGGKAPRPLTGPDPSGSATAPEIAPAIPAPERSAS
jgi:Xaa-Pro aminopeptidase